jgi:hypothetical protein
MLQYENLEKHMAVIKLNEQYTNRKELMPVCVAAPAGSHHPIAALAGRSSRPIHARRHVSRPIHAIGSKAPIHARQRCRDHDDAAATWPDTKCQDARCVKGTGLEKATLKGGLQCYKRLDPEEGAHSPSPPNGLTIIIIIIIIIYGVSHCAGQLGGNRSPVAILKKSKPLRGVYGACHRAGQLGETGPLWP